MDGPTGVEEYESGERARLLHIERLILFVCVGTCVFMLALGLLVDDRWAAGISAAGIVLLGGALVLNLIGRLRSTIFVMATIALALVTLTAATGDGLYDLSMVAYPAILLFAGLTMRPRAFVGFLCIVFLAVVSVPINQNLVFLPLRPGKTPPFAALMIMLSIMGITAFAAGLLASSFRRALATAHREIARRVKIEAELADLSLRDVLTGVQSRRAFENELERLRVSRRYPVSVLFADVDALKRVNDTHGHRAGDRLLMRAARVLGSVVRAEDLLARIGGDEFAVLLPETDCETSCELLGRIEAMLADGEDPSEVPLGLSIGVATAHAGELDDAIARADAMMYEKKSAKKLTA